MQNQLVTSGFPPNISSRSRPSGAFDEGNARPNFHAESLKSGAVSDAAISKFPRGTLIANRQRATLEEHFHGESVSSPLPSKSALARKWPKLHVNRYTGRWRDDASGARGDDLKSLLTFLGEGAR